MNQKSGTFNRLDLTNTINWNFVEHVEYLPQRSESGMIQRQREKIIIHFQSGNTLEITDTKKIIAIKELIGVFPDIENDAVRQGIVTRANEEQKIFKHDMMMPLKPGIKHDMMG